MLKDEFESINEKLDSILAIHSSVPEWYPLTGQYAKEKGYASIDGLRKWCINNLHPDLFVKKGKHWYVHKSALSSVKMKTG